MRFLYVFLISILLVACKSTSIPSWYLVDETSENQVTAVGEGFSLKQAKLAALEGINSRLWTQVESSLSTKESVRNINEDEFISSYTNNDLKSNTSKITFNSVKFIKSEQAGDLFYVKASVSKDSLIDQMTKEIEMAEEDAKIQYKNKNSSDPIRWWLENRNIDEKVEYVFVRKSILSGLKHNIRIDTKFINKLYSEMDLYKGDILIRIDNNSKSKHSLFVSEIINKQGIKTTRKKSKNNSHVLQIENIYREAEVGDAFIATVITEFSLKNRKGEIIGQSELISTGNSVTNFSFAKEGAERHFADQLANKGIWNSLNIQSQLK
ncbi:hypothetical protein HGP28_03710 [Vibrio sp. SM6]|uniref:LPP20 lipoprotein n=1 Tax=Vibrio agarilyticus TaxID=2726741 RepID=A0A7X8TNF5_9VIBR|nr:LPP20 family lipoprotein [Vibrio agarilyticus]NLS11997.1 hypothetical protein [Vibrio agarilyticus]